MHYGDLVWVIFIGFIGVLAMLDMFTSKNDGKYTNTDAITDLTIH